MKKLILIFMIAIGILGGIFAGMPAVSMAQAPAEQTKSNYKVILDCKDGKPIPGTDGKEKACTFTDFMRQVDHIVSLLLYVAVLLAVISFVYAGFKLIFSGGNEDAVKHAKHIFLNVVVGLVLAYGAWIIVHFIITTLGVEDGYSLIKP